MTSNEPERIAVIGDGSWATGLVAALGHKGHHLQWNFRKPEAAEAFRQSGRNPDYLQEHRLPAEHITATTEVKAAVAGVDGILLVVPGAYLATHLAGLGPGDFAGKWVLSGIKGLDQQTGRLVSQTIQTDYQVPPEQYAAVLGPSHAEEVVQGWPTYLTICGHSPATCEKLAGLLRSPAMHVGTTPDAEGAEYAAVLKNVYAVAAGLSHGLGYGDNFRAVLVAAALREMDAFLQAKVPGERHIGDAVYAGDLLVTAFSRHSRNRRLGEALGSGTPLSQLLGRDGMVAEGFFAVRHLVESHGVDLPIVNGVYRILYQDAPAQDAFRELEQALT